MRLFERPRVAVDEQHVHALTSQLMGRCEPDAARSMHRLDHIVDELLQLRRVGLNGHRFLAQEGLAERVDGKHHGKGEVGRAKTDVRHSNVALRPSSR